MGSINYNILLVINVEKWVIIARSHGEEYRILVKLRDAENKGGCAEPAWQKW